MKLLSAVAVVTMALCFAANAATLTSASCDGGRIAGESRVQQPAKVCPVQRVAEQKRCSCVTYAGTRCTGPCLSAGKPYGCECK
jgi:hypothetical protein